MSTSRVITAPIGATGPTGPAGSAGLSIDRFGDGSDGDVALDGTNTYTSIGISKSGNFYTLTRDCYFNNLTISGSARMNTGSWRFFVAGVFDATGAGTGAVTHTNTTFTGNGGNGDTSDNPGLGGTVATSGGSIGLSSNSGGGGAGAGNSGGNGGNASFAPSVGAFMNGGSQNGGGPGGAGSLGTGGTANNNSDLSALRLPMRWADPLMKTILTAMEKLNL